MVQFCKFLNKISGFCNFINLLKMSLGGKSLKKLMEKHFFKNILLAEVRHDFTFFY